MEKAKKCYFTITGENDIFEGYTLGETWNGFEVPLFTLNTILDILKFFKITTYEHKEDTDAFYYWEDETGECYYIATGGDIETEDGAKHLYRFNGGWVWMKAKGSKK